MTEPYTTTYVKARIEDAGRTMMMLPGHGCKPAGAKSGWPEYQREFADLIEAPADNTRTRIRPTGKQISELEEVMDWIVLLACYSKLRKVRWIAKAVAYGMLHKPSSGRRKYSWRALGRKFSVSHNTVKKWYGEGIEIITNLLELERLANE